MRLRGIAPGMHYARFVLIYRHARIYEAFVVRETDHVQAESHAPTPARDVRAFQFSSAMRETYPTKHPKISHIRALPGFRPARKTAHAFARQVGTSLHNIGQPYIASFCRS